MQFLHMLKQNKNNQKILYLMISVENFLPTLNWCLPAHGVPRYETWFVLTVGAEVLGKVVLSISRTHTLLTGVHDL